MRKKKQIPNWKTSLLFWTELFVKVIPVVISIWNIF